VETLVEEYFLPGCTGGGCQELQGIIPGYHPYQYGTTTIKTNKWIYSSGYNLSLGSDDTIILSGGDYYFDSISLTGEACIQVGVDTDSDGVVDAPPNERVYIYVQGPAKLTGGGIMNTGRPTDLVIISSAGPSDYVEVLGEVAVSGSNEFRGVVIAPKTLVKISGECVFKGSALAKAVYAMGSGGVHYDEDLENTIPIKGYVIPIGWKDTD
jgi:hypothetical protein